MLFRSYVIQLIEVGYCPDTRWKLTLEKTKLQHAQLKGKLMAAGWTVGEHFIILGRAGTCFNHTLNTLQALGMRKEQAVKLMGKLHLHTVTKLHEIVIARRRLERRPMGEPPD